MKRIVVPCALFLLAVPVLAGEGMWRPGQLPEIAGDLRDAGIEIAPERLTDLTAHPMNAVISLGGCTASFVSAEGLAITNYHCAKGAIQYNSTEEKNLLEEGFLARDRSEELGAGPGSRILVTVEVSDVTEKVVGGLEAGLGGAERYRAIEAREKALVAKCEEDEGHRCRVRAYHGGLEYELIKQLEIKDVRLVYAPAAMIGEYGGEIDNWMWPRHTGDYSFYRAYVGPDGKPADPAEENVPFRPKHFLKIATDPLEAGDFVMVAGYPGRTNRYRTATEVEETFAWDYPTRKRVFEQWRGIIAETAGEDKDLEIKYARTMAGLDNATKNYGGMLNGFAKGDMLERKAKLEADLQTWIEGDEQRRERYLSALEELRAVAAESNGLRERGMFYEYLARRGELLQTARTLYRLAREKQKPDMDREPGYQERDFGRLKERMVRISRSYAAEVDRAFYRYFLLLYAATPADQHVAVFDEWFGIDGNQVDEAALDAKLDAMYAGSTLGEEAVRLAWMEKQPADLEASDDPYIQLAVKMFDSDMQIEEQRKDLRGRFDEVRPRYMEALIAFLGSQGKVVYPDANSSLRVTYGTVQGYRPRDGVLYTPFTVIRGIADKHTGEEPFDVPAAELEAIRADRVGRWADEALGTVPVNFLTDVDTTGGNSGSATLNGKGELIGLIFDGNWESIISDWDFLPDVTRSIHVDIRYVLWVMEEIDGAGHLLEEMGVAAGR
jgi:hypothetical protein